LSDASVSTGDRSWFSNTRVAPDQTVFDGRPDLGHADMKKIWELKPEGSELKGLAQVWDYSLSTLMKYKPSDSAPNFFSGNSLVLPGSYGTITYNFVSHGVINYQYDLNRNVVKVPSFSLFGLPMPAAAGATAGVPAGMVPVF
jgi:hypothetical protein